MIYNEMLKETFWGCSSPSKETDENLCHPNILVSPLKKTNKEQKPFKSKILKFNFKKSDKENKHRAVRNNPLKFKEFRIQGLGRNTIEKVTRIQAEKVLDAPNMVDDFYLNLLDWSNQNVLAIALHQTAYLMDVTNKNIDLIQPKANNCLITSLSWMDQSRNKLAIGMENGVVEVWDAEYKKIIRELHGHYQRVSSLSWNRNIISTGSLDSSIINHDIRSRHHIVSRLEDHSKEVCGLKWSFDGSQLASGSNDNTL